MFNTTGLCDKGALPVLGFWTHIFYEFPKTLIRVPLHTQWSPHSVFYLYRFQIPAEAGLFPVTSGPALEPSQRIAGAS